MVTKILATKFGFVPDSSVCVCVNHLLVRWITRDPLKLGSLNLDQRCKTPWLSSLLFWGANIFDLQGQIWLKKSDFLASPLLGIHNHHITIREPWIPRLLHRTDCFMVSILCTYSCTYLGSRGYFGVERCSCHLFFQLQSFFPRVSINDNTVLVHVMASCQSPANRHLFNLWEKLLKDMSHINE